MTAPTLDELRAASLVRPIDYHFARTITKLAGESREELVVAAALTSARLGAGHVCLDLEGLAGQSITLDDGSVRQYPSLARWTAALLESPLVSAADDGVPLILGEAHRLYMRRYWLHEQFLAGSILARVNETSNETGSETTDAPARAVEELFPGAGEDDKQRQAALLATQHRFAVVSGGPGTGKTFTVVKILALLVEQALAAGQPAPRMTLLAPTGKAAARLVESIQKAKSGLPSAQHVKDAITDEASTIHRALGSIPGSSTRFRHNKDNPLVTDLVLVDEASMVNVALMSRLLAAIPSHARLILLGDKDQLASVDAGAVLGDICNAGHAPPVANAMPRVAQCVTHLTRSYRYQPGSGIEALAKAVNAGDSAAALQVLASDAYSDVQLRPALPGNRLGTSLPTQIGRGYKAFHEASSPELALAALGEFRVLCAHHSGNASVSSINDEVRRQLDQRGRATPGNAHYAGQPIMVSVNDYDLRLFNGDIGAVMQTPDGLRVFFESTEGPPRCVAPARLPAYSPVYAMSVHKSQGSEFSDIAIVLPQETSPVLTRELIYTAVTRAKKSLTIYAEPGLLRACIETSTRRSSGLRDLLWA